MDSKLKGKIITAIRKLTYTYAPRNEVKNRAKVAPATFKCEQCESILYTGQAKEIPEKIKQQFPNTIKAKVNIDHIDPVIPLEGFINKEWDWNIFMDRTFCPIDNLQLLCEACHKEKTYLETQIRKDFRELNKKS